MGEAKKRGTREERVAAAIERDRGISAAEQQRHAALNKVIGDALVKAQAITEATPRPALAVQADVARRRRLGQMLAVGAVIAAAHVPPEMLPEPKS